MRFIAVDTETTGFASPELVELAAFDIETKQSFCERICPPKLIDAHATAVHGIRDEDVLNCRKTSDVLADFQKFLGSGPITLIAHNAPFDKRVLETSFHNAGLNLDAQWICTMAMSKQRYPDKKVPHSEEPVKHTLKDCCQRASVPQLDGHSALPDAQMCAAIQKDFLEQDLYAEALLQVREANPFF